MSAVPPESLTESTRLAYFFLVSTSELLSTDQKKLDIPHEQSTNYIQEMSEIEKYIIDFTYEEQ